MNPMRDIGVEKVTINIGAGNDQEHLEKAIKLIEKLTGRKPVKTKARKRIPTFGIRKGLEIGAKVTLRGKQAYEFLDLCLKGKNYKLSPKVFDKTGNFSIGIKEYIELPGVKYDPELGLMGMDVAVTLYRPGWRVAKRRRMRSKIGHTHKITKKEAMEFAEKVLKAKVEDE